MFLQNHSPEEVNWGQKGHINAESTTETTEARNVTFGKYVLITIHVTPKKLFFRNHPPQGVKWGLKGHIS